MSIKALERKLAESEQKGRALQRELQHRAKNIVASIRSLAYQTYVDSTDLDAFYETFDGRLQALGRFQTFIEAGFTQWVDLKEMLADEFLACAARVDREIDINGPDLEIEIRVAQTLSLAFHELATNSIAHGALARDNGRVSVRWRIATNATKEILTLEWQEAGVPLPEQADITGLSRRLIEQALPFEVGGRSRLEFGGDGLRCVMEVPLGDRVRRADAANDEEGHPDAFE